jgi:hypothetical protein
MEGLLHRVDNGGGVLVFEQAGCFFAEPLEAERVDRIS